MQDSPHPRQGQEGRQPAVFHPLVNLPFSLGGHGGDGRTETIKERQRIFSTVGGAQCAPISLPIRSVRYRSATHMVYSTQGAA